MEESHLSDYLFFTPLDPFLSHPFWALVIGTITAVPHACCNDCSKPCQWRMLPNSQICFLTLPWWTYKQNLITVKLVMEVSSWRQVNSVLCTWRWEDWPQQLSPPDRVSVVKRVQTLCKTGRDNWCLIFEKNLNIFHQMLIMEYQGLLWNSTWNLVHHHNLNLL